MPYSWAHRSRGRRKHRRPLTWQETWSLSNDYCCCCCRCGCSNAGASLLLQDLAVTVRARATTSSVTSLTVSVSVHFVFLCLPSSELQYAFSLDQLAFQLQQRSVECRNGQETVRRLVSAGGKISRRRRSIAETGRFGPWRQLARSTLGHRRRAPRGSCAFVARQNFSTSVATRKRGGACAEIRRRRVPARRYPGRRDWRWRGAVQREACVVSGAWPLASDHPRRMRPNHYNGAGRAHLPAASCPT